MLAVDKNANSYQNVVIMVGDAPDEKKETNEEGAKVLKVKAFTKDAKKPSHTKDEETEKEKVTEASESEPKPEPESEAPKETPEVKEDKPAESAPASDPVSSFSMLDQDESKDSGKSEKKVEESPAKETIEIPDENGESADKLKVSSDEVKKWLSDSHSEDNKELDKKRGINFKTLFLVLLVLALISVIVGGVFYYRSKVPSETPSEESENVVRRVDEVSPTESLTPAPDESEEVDLSEYTLQIQNGSGIPGEAGVVEILLTDPEFSDITTGNADAYDYTDTQVQMKEEVPDEVYELIAEALEGSYTVVKNEDPLAEDSEYDVIIIVGVKK